MVLDVILDTSSLTEKQLLMIDEQDSEMSQARRRVRVDGRDTDPRQASSSDRRGSLDALDTYRNGIVLETWKLHFADHPFSDTPDLPMLYRHATIHFKEVFHSVSNLPAHRLHQRLKAAYSSTASARSDKHEAADEDIGQLKVGVRLSISPSDGFGVDSSGIIGVQEAVGSSKHSPSIERVTTNVHAYAPIDTPIGSLAFSVEYRLNTDFYVEDWHEIKALQETELDEDYFKPLPNKDLVKQRITQSGSGTSSPKRTSYHERPKSLLSVTSQKKQQNPSPDSSQATYLPSNENSPKAAPASLGTPSSLGRPVAGLSSLRASPSVTGYATSTTATSNAITSGATTPALAAALTSDAAFLPLGRKTSTSERRIRTMSTLSSGEKESPPSPSMTSSVMASRPILSRAAASTIPKSGSYSPSSPSPLAQQYYAQQATIASGGSRLSSSPSFRANFGASGASVSPSLRSVFQSTTPSLSQTSVSSLSRTPPKSLLETPTRGTDSMVQCGPSTQAGTPSLSGSRQPSVAPQMIKRYSSTFSYRRGRQDNSVDSDGSGNAPYSKSWQARIEQRQAFSARSLGRDDGVGASRGSISSSPRPQRIPSYVSSASPNDDVDELVRMIDSRPSLLGREPSLNSSSLTKSSFPSQYEAHEPVSRQEGPTYPTVSSASQIRGMSRSQIDDMLQKMRHSVRDFSTSSTSRYSAASGDGDLYSSPDEPRGPLRPSSTTTQSPLSQAAVINAQSNESNAVLTRNKEKSHFGNIHQEASGSSKKAGSHPAPPKYGQLQEEQPKRELGEEEDTDSHFEERLSRSHPGPRGSLELYVGASSYDPLDDEAAGRLELASDDVVSDGGGPSAPLGRQGSSRLTHPRSSSPHATRTSTHRTPIPRPLAVGMGPLGHVMNKNTNAHDRNEQQRDDDRQLAKNFTATVGASSMRGGQAGRRSGNSHSPWRQRGFHPTTFPVGSPGTGTTSHESSAFNSGRSSNNPSPGLD